MFRKLVPTLVFSLFLFISTLHSLSAQGGGNDYYQTLRGTVLEKSTREPLPGATVIVYLGEKQLFSTTNLRGEFSIKNVPVGRCNVSISMIGFTPYMANGIVVYSGKEAVIEVLLEETISELSEAVISAKTDKTQPLNKLAVVSARMLSSEEANRYAGSWGDPARMVSNFAGVTATQDSRNDIIVRGNSPTGVQWRLDGFEIPNPNHFGMLGGTGGPVGMLNNNQLANSDFYTGAFPAEFGNVTAGLYDLRLRNGNNQKHEFIAAIGFNGLELGAEGPISKQRGSSYMINARYSFLKIMEKVGINFGTGGTPEYKDMTSKINIPLRNGNLSWVTMLGGSKVHYFSETEKESDYVPNTQVNNYDMRISNDQIFTGINYTHRFATSTRLENRISYQRFFRGIDDKRVGYPTPNVVMIFTGREIAEQYDINLSLYSKIGNQISIKSGITLSIYHTDLENISRTTRIIQSCDDYSSLFKAFTELQHPFNDSWSVTSGIYTQNFSLNGNYSFEPRIGVKWRASQTATFSLGGGMYSQLQPKEVYFFRKKNVETNIELGMSRNFQGVIGYNQKIRKDLNLKTELYYQHLYNIPVLPGKPAESIINMGDDYYNDWDAVFVNKGTGRNYGIEITLEKYLNKNYYFLLTGTLYDSFYTGYDTIERRTRFAGNYSLNALAGYEWKLGKRTLLSLNTRICYIGGKRVVPLKEQANGNFTPDYTRAYEERLPDYFRVDLNLAMKQNFRLWSMEWFFELSNLTNHKNVGTKYFDYTTKKVKYMFQLGLTPIGGCRVYF